MKANRCWQAILRIVSVALVACHPETHHCRALDLNLEPTGVDHGAAVGYPKII